MCYDLFVFDRLLISFVLSDQMVDLEKNWYTHRVISVKVNRLLVTLSYFRLDRFVQLLSLIPILILLFYHLVSINLVYTGLCELVLGVYPEGEQLYSKIHLNCSGADTTSSFTIYKQV